MEINLEYPEDRRVHDPQLVDFLFHVIVKNRPVNGHAYLC